MKVSFFFRPLLLALRMVFFTRSRGKRLLNFLLMATLSCGIFSMILILSIMNGLQSGYINAIVEVSSYHLRLEGEALSPPQEQKIKNDRNFLSMIPFYETQTVMAGRNGLFNGYLLRALPPHWREADSLMAKEIKTIRGELDLTQPNTVAISRTLALSQGILVGDEISLISLSAKDFSLLDPPIKSFRVVGVFETAFREIDQLLILTGMESWSPHFSAAPLIYGIKLKNRFSDQPTIQRLRSFLPEEIQIKSWRESHRSFFSALKLEKNAMTFLLGLVSGVVVLNLFFMIKRLIFEKQKEIATLKTMGISPREIEISFLLIGLIMGTTSVFVGVSAGLLVSTHFASFISLIESFLFSLSGGYFGLVDLRFFYDLPVAVEWKEVLAIACLSLVACGGASYAATKRIAQITPCEVLRYE